MRKSIADRIREAVREAALKSGAVPEGELPQIVVEKPRSPEHGDFSTNVAMLLSARAGRRPEDLAADIAARIDKAAASLSDVEIQKPGFINMRLSRDFLEENLRVILTEAEDYGKSDFGGGEPVQVEFVSANPTGPLNVVSARAAAVGDSLVRLMKACGYDARSEFFVNDSGTQVELLGLSLKARVEEALGRGEAKIPDQGYHGQYLADLAGEIPREKALEMLDDAGETSGRFSRFAVERMHEAQKSGLEAFGVRFDQWFRESSLHTAGRVEETLKALRQSGLVYEKDGALWLKTSGLGDDGDRVVRKSSGEPTYFLSDIAYHKNKFERGFKKVIDIWGPDHHGHVPRMKAAARALRYPEDWLEVLIVQWVRLVRGTTPVSMSKRAGEFVTLSDLVSEVGTDCARFFFLMRRVESHLDFDLDLAKKQSDENPVYYVQYAHARVSSILEFAREAGVGFCTLGEADLKLLQTPEEVAVMRELANFPEYVRAACATREPQRITSYLTSVATALHQFYHHSRVVGTEQNLMQARLVLVRAVRTVIRNGLDLIGVSAPDKM
ncbi:MAG: arginine--tRNA ligase [Candidatus Eisenbacteria bacterium]|nr:arginine--tRNA ligase [Candidatus Eisenbacteria bacterium]